MRRAPRSEGARIPHRDLRAMERGIGHIGEGHILRIQRYNQRAAQQEAASIRRAERYSQRVEAWTERCRVLKAEALLAGEPLSSVKLPEAPSYPATERLI